MSTLKQRFTELAAENPEISQADIARATGAKKPSVNGWFSGESKTMKAVPAIKAALRYGVNPLWLASGEGPKRPKLPTGEAISFEAKVLAAQFDMVPESLNPLALKEELEHVIVGWMTGTLPTPEPRPSETLKTPFSAPCTAPTRGNAPTPPTAGQGAPQKSRRR